MQFKTGTLLLLGAMALPAPGAAQTTPAPSATTRTVLAATKLPTVTDAPLHFKAVSVILQPGEKSSVSAPDGVLYRLSGSTEVSLDGETKMLNAGEGRYIANGKTAALTAGTGAPSTFLHFFLVSAADALRFPIARCVTEEVLAGGPGDNQASEHHNTARQIRLCG